MAYRATGRGSVDRIESGIDPFSCFVGADR
jgi:hypothetical protein